MPKLKTHKGVKKRVKITASGKLKRSKAFASHLMSGKSRKRCRRLKKQGLIPTAKEKTYRLIAGKA